MDFAPHRANRKENNSSLPFPQGAAWLLERLKSYDYQIDEQELVHSFSWIGLTAILCDQIDLLSHRLNVLLSINSEKFSEEMHIAKQKMVQLIIETRHQIQLELAKEFNLPTECSIKTFESTLTYHQKQHFYQLVHQAIDHKKSHTNFAKAHELVDVLGLLESLDLYQNAYQHAKSKLMTQTAFHNGFNTPFTVPSPLQKEGGMVQVKLFTGSYSCDELTTFFRTLHMTLNKILNFNKPFGLTVNNANHTIAIGILNNEWVILDFKNLNFSPLNDDREVAEKVFLALAYPHAHSTLLSTKIYAAKKNVSFVEKCLETWTSMPEFILIHK